MKKILIKLCPYFVGILFGISISVAVCFFYHKNHSKQDKFKFVEIVSYKLKDKISTEQHSAIISSINKELATIQGFKKRTIIKTNQDLYYDIVFWKKEDSYLDAVENMKSKQIMSDYMNIIENYTINVITGDVETIF